MAQVLEINGRNTEIRGTSSLDFFVYSTGGEVSSDIVLEHDTITLHCLDHESQRLIFTDIPADIDLRAVPMFYDAQRDNATRLIAVPYAELPDLAAQVKMPETLVFIFSTGRAGSTLMNQILNEVDGVSSLSEPDVFANLATLSNQVSDRESLIDLLAQCCQLTVKSYADDKVAIKHRGVCIVIADLFYKAFPAAKNLFMYRNAIEWAASWRRLDTQQSLPKALPIERVREIANRTWGSAMYWDRYIEPDTNMMTESVGSAIQWMSLIDAYLDRVEQGIPFGAVRYHDLNTRRRDTLSKIFDYIGLSIDDLDQGMHGFERDSQAGTWLQKPKGSEHTVQLDDDYIQSMNNAFAHHPRHIKPDTILPGTLQP